MFDYIALPYTFLQEKINTFLHEFILKITDIPSIPKWSSAN